MKQALLFLYSITPMVMLAQQNNTQLTDDLVEIRMKITDSGHQPIATPVFVQYGSSSQKIKAITNDSGMAAVVVKTGEMYKISIPASDDYYEYEIPEFAASPVEVSFLFHPRPKTQREIPIMIYGSDDALCKISIKSELGEKITLPVVKKKAILFAEEGNTYNLISTGDLQIDAPKIMIKEGVPSHGYVMYFTENNKARLETIYPGRSYVFLSLLDPFKKSIDKSEVIYVKNQCNGEAYTWKTHSNGTYFTEIKANENLCLSLNHLSNITFLSSGSGSKEIEVKEIELAYGSSEQQLQNIKTELTSFLFKDRMSVWDTKDQKTNMLSDFLGFDRQKDDYIKEINGERFVIVPDTFTGYVKLDMAISSVLNRNKYNWKNRVIVADARSTMYINLKELSYWRVVEESEHNLSDYMIIGNYNIPIQTVRGTRISDSVFSSMLSNKLIGREGSPLARGLIEAVNHFGRERELILVADASLPVSDLALLEDFNVPVKVLLCDTKKSVIDPGYFEIVLRTGGSIHTLTEDLAELGKTPEGKTVMVSGKQYRKSRNSFYYVCDQ